MTIERRHVIVKGVVQGVGFRPFVYRLATEHHLAGSVCNCGNAGVEILIEGPPGSISSFLRDLRDRHPLLARIESIDSQLLEPIGERSFSIVSSQKGGDGSGSIPPDIAVCSNCLEDIFGESRYRGYWATSCTDCGPRFTVIESLPYDRPRTSMREFPMCAACEAEYTDPLDRRYHAQTIACPQCGPRLTFDQSEKKPIEEAVAALKAGLVVAIKGIGGTHLACDATNEQAVKTLRRRLGRPGQPFALMASEALLSRIAKVNAEEWEALRSARRPIVVLYQRPGALPQGVAPGLHTVGVMLPYTGLHHLLFDLLKVPLVMTSANLPGRPMLIENELILGRLAGIADHFLLHNRRIVSRCDDSVLRRSGGTVKLLRRSRGYVPQPIEIDLGEEPILALGPETDLVFAVYVNGAVTLSQHIGAVDELESYAFLKEAIDHLYRLTGAAPPRIVACDLHPTFLTTRHAEQLAGSTGARLVRVQHHEAHLAAVMGEHHVKEAVGIVLDGFGYGHDGTAWGGEVFLAKRGRIERVGSLAPVLLPGADLAVRYPLRMTASFLHAAGIEQGEIARVLSQEGLSSDEAGVILTQIEGGWNAPQTTSAGRFLDAVAALLGICQERTYEGEPAMLLEAAAAAGRPIELSIEFRELNGRLILDTVEIFRELYTLFGRKRPADLAASAQVGLAQGIAHLAIEVTRREKVAAIALSGGVAYNDAISSHIRQAVERAGLAFFTNERVPCGDGGVAFGQLFLAANSDQPLVADSAYATAGEQKQSKTDD